MKQRREERMPLGTSGSRNGSSADSLARQTEQISIALNAKLSLRQEIWFSDIHDRIWGCVTRSLT